MQQGKPRPKRSDSYPYVNGMAYVPCKSVADNSKEFKKEPEDLFPMDPYHQTVPHPIIQTGLKRHRPDYIPYPQPEAPSDNALRTSSVNKDYFKSSLSSVPQPTFPDLKRGQFRPILPKRSDSYPCVDSGQLRKAKKSTGLKSTGMASVPFKSAANNLEDFRKEPEDLFPMDPYHQTVPDPIIQTGLKHHRPDYIPYPQPEAPSDNTLRISSVNRDYFKSRLSRSVGDSYNPHGKISKFSEVERSASKELQDNCNITEYSSPPHSPDLFDEPAEGETQEKGLVVHVSSEHAAIKGKASADPIVLEKPTSVFVPLNNAASPFAKAISTRKISKEEKVRDTLKATALQKYSKMSPASKLAIIKEVREKRKDTMNPDQDLAYRSSLVKRMHMLKQSPEYADHTLSDKLCSNENKVSHHYKTVYKNLSPIILKPDVNSLTTENPSKVVPDPERSLPVSDSNPSKSSPQFRSKTGTKTADKAKSSKTRLSSASAPPPTAVSNYPGKENTAFQPTHKRSKYRFRAPFYYKFHKDVGPNSTYNPNMSTELEIGDNFLGAIVELTSSKKSSGKKPKSFLLSSPTSVTPLEIPTEKYASNLAIPGDQLFPMGLCVATSTGQICFRTNEQVVVKTMPSKENPNG